MNAFHRLLLTLVVAAPLCGWAQTTLLPVDQASSVPDFFSFRARLIAALARHDLEAVTAVLAKDAKPSFGGDAGIDGFKKLWKPGAPDSKLWETLATILALGGTFEADGTFTAPYVFTRWPAGEDAFTRMAATGSGVRVRASPSITAPTIGSLEFSTVEIAGPVAPESKWVQIKLPSGQAGFVDGRYLRSPIDYRVSFAKLEGRWQITLFLDGD